MATCIAISLEHLSCFPSCFPRLMAWTSRLGNPSLGRQDSLPTLPANQCASVILCCPVWTAPSTLLVRASLFSFFRVHRQTCSQNHPQRHPRFNTLGFEAGDRIVYSMPTSPAEPLYWCMARRLYESNQPLLGAMEKADFKTYQDRYRTVTNATGLARNVIFPLKLVPRISGFSSQVKTNMAISVSKSLAKVVADLQAYTKSKWCATKSQERIRHHRHGWRSL